MLEALAEVIVSYFSTALLLLTAVLGYALYRLLNEFWEQQWARALKYCLVPVFGVLCVYSIFWGYPGIDGSVGLQGRLMDAGLGLHERSASLAAMHHFLRGTFGLIGAFLMVAGWGYVLLLLLMDDQARGYARGSTWVPDLGRARLAAVELWQRLLSWLRRRVWGRLFRRRDLRFQQDHYPACEVQWS